MNLRGRRKWNPDQIPIEIQLESIEIAAANDATTDIVFQSGSASDRTPTGLWPKIIEFSFVSAVSHGVSE